MNLKEKIERARAEAKKGEKVQRQVAAEEVSE
jgi:hypothetical protein